MVREFDCPSCGAPLRPKPGEYTARCEHCESTVVVPPDAMKRGPVLPRIKGRPSQGSRSLAVLVISMVILILGISAAVFFFTMRSVDETTSRIMEGVGGVPGTPPGGAGPEMLLSFGGSGTGTGRFTDPRHIGVDSEGRIWVGEYESGRIQVFDREGGFITQWRFSEERNPYLTGFDVSPGGTAFVITSSELLMLDGMTGEPIDTLRHPDGTGFDDVVATGEGGAVAAWYRNRDDILRFGPDGKLELLVEEAVSGPLDDSELDIMVAVDGLGTIYGLGWFCSCVVRYSPDGRFEDRFGSEGDGPGQFFSPDGILASPDGRVLVSDWGELKVYEPDGRYLGSIELGTNARDIVMDSSMRLYAVTADDSVVVMDVSAPLASLR